MGCPMDPGIPLGEKVSGGGYRDKKKLFAGAKIFFADGQPPQKIPRYTPGFKIDYLYYTSKNRLDL